MRTRIALLAALLFSLATPAAGQTPALSDTRIREIAQWLPEKPAGFGPPCAERSPWREARVQERFAPLAREAARLLAQPFPAWDEEAYLEFSRKGIRPAGEQMINDRTAWLPRLVLAECLEYEGRYLARLHEVLDALSAQPTWTWPAHDKKLDNLRRRSYEVDLNAAEVAHEIAQALYMLGDRIAPEVRERAQKALRERIFEPVRRSLAGHAGNWWLTVNHNWNAVCLDGVTGAALAAIADRNERAVFAAAAEHYSLNYLGGFPEDGYALEGVGYWNYGFSRYAELRERLWQSTRGRLDLFAFRKIEAIALYPDRFEMFPGNTARFGDAGLGTRPDAAVRGYALRALGLAAEESGPIPLRTDRKTVLPWNVMTVFPNSTDGVAQRSRTAATDPLRSYFADATVWVARPAPGGVLAVSAKAGGNANHSHNDIGSYVIGRSAEQPAGDPGGPRHYTAETFGPRRYEFRLLNSWGHPVPVVNERLQLEANKVRPAVLDVAAGAGEDRFVIDMRPAYDDRTLSRLERHFRYNRQGAHTVEVEDRFSFTRPGRFETAIVTRGTWQAASATVIDITAGKETVRAEILSSAPFDLVPETVTDMGNTFTRIGVRLRDPQSSGQVTVRYTAP